MATDEGGWPVPADSLGGATGTLGAGTNMLQGSIDNLTTAVNQLKDVMKASKPSGGYGGGMPSGAGLTLNFARPVNPFGLNAMPGIGGGGPGGTGNVRPPATFGQMGATTGAASGGIGLGGVGGLTMRAFAGSGGLTRTELAMNAYAGASRLGMNVGNGYQAAQAMSFRQAFGVNNTNLNALAVSPFDAIAGTQQLQYLGGSPNYMSTSLGRAGFGATAGFGIANPMLSMQQSSALAQQLYSPTLSQRMMAMGFPVTPRGLGGTAPASSAMVAQSLIQGLYGGRRFVSSAALDKGLGLGGRANASIQALGLNPTQMTPFLQTYNQLFQRGLNTNQAQALINQASRGTVSSMKAAQQRLSDLGVSTSDIQKLKDNQAIGTSRSADIANGFNAGLTAATGTLESFNQALTGLMNNLGLSSFSGFAGGFGGGMGAGHLLGGLAGTAGGGILQGLIMKRMLTGGASSLVAGGVGAGAEGGMLAKLGLGGLTVGGAIGTAGVGALLLGLNSMHNKNGTTLLQQGPGGPKSAWNSWGTLLHDIGGFFSGGGGGQAAFNARFGGSVQPNRMGGAGPSVPQSAQGAGNKNKNTSGASASAMNAVKVAEQFVGTPYVWGGDSPQVGFDCSGLIEYAYSQAGVRLPRTSEEQWQFLSRRAVNRNSVMAGDILFSAGSLGTPNNPGHEAMMINGRQIIEAPHTGADVRIRAYNPGEWAHAARVKGGLGGGAGLPIGGGPGNSITGNTGDAGSAMGGAPSGINFSESATASNLGELAALGGGGISGGAAAQLMGSASPLSGGGRKNRGRTGHGPLGGISGGGNIAQNKNLMKKLAAAYGWGSGSQWDALDWLVMAESGYNNLIWEGGAIGGRPGAGSSGAYGIAQALPASKYPPAGRPSIMGGQSDPKTQEIWMLNYVAGRYQTPSNAKAFHLAHNWYGGGGDPKAGSWGIVGDRGPELVNFGRDAKVKSNKDTMDLLKGHHAMPAQTPWKVPGEKDIVGDKFRSRGMNINLTFGPSAIVINMDHGPEFDASKSGRMIAEQIVRHLSSEDVLDSIGKGRKL